MRGLMIMGAAAAFSLGALAYSAPAHATAFGPASLGFSTSITGGATYTLGASSDTLTLGYNPNINGHSGNLSGITSGTSRGTLSFSTTIGVTMNQSLASAFTFTDPSTYDPSTSPYSGTYTFNVSSVETTYYNYDASQDLLNVSLYILGIVSGGTAGYTGTPTSIAFDLTGQGGRSYNSGTLRNPPDQDPNPPAPPPAAPPAQVPEPQGWAVFGTGLIGLVAMRYVGLDRLMRRRSARRQDDVAPLGSVTTA